MKIKNFASEHSPAMLFEEFASITSPHDVASLLEIDYGRLLVYLYKIKPNKRYRVFSVPKRSKGERKISVPFGGLKFVQKKLALVLEALYQPSREVHGFVPGRSILTNAQKHARQKYVLNIDIRDFFPSINFGRVRGMFIHYYAMDPSSATILAQICCFDNELPQGAPTSPIVSNMICRKLDKELAHFANKHGCTYSRYADDLTFSTSDHYFPREIARIRRIPDSPGQIRLGTELQDIIEDNGFGVHWNKARLQGGNERQVVTGLVVNRFPNVRRRFVRQIRAMLHAWGKYGLEAAQAEHYRYFARKYRGPFGDAEPPFKSIVRGKIAFLGMVRGKKDKIYIRYWNQLVKLAPEYGNPIPLQNIDRETQRPSPRIFMEGKTDAKHLQAAINYFHRLGHFHYLSPIFDNDTNDDDLGHDKLLKLCESHSRAPNSEPRVFIFDRDVPSTVKNRVVGKNGGVKQWGNNVYSCLLPVPKHREEDADSVCIELFYRDDDLLRKDENGRRLFLNREFLPKGGRHKELDLICSDRNKLSRDHVTIIDSGVYDFHDYEEQNLALAKNAFATYILERTPPFDHIDFSPFKPVFELIDNVVEMARNDNTAP